MYYRALLRDVVRIPPTRLADPLQQTLLDTIREKLEGKLDRELGMIIAITKLTRVGEGRLVLGDPGVYYDLEFEAILFKPELQELVEGRVNDIVEFGAFVQIGPMDALLHVSQVLDDYLSYDGRSTRLVARQSRRSLSEGEKLRARIVAVSLNEREPGSSKIGLTMRQPGLGSFRWLEELRQKQQSQ